MLLEWLARHQDGRENFARAGKVIESAINTLDHRSCPPHRRSRRAARDQGLHRCPRLAHFSTSGALGRVQAALPDKRILTAPMAAVTALRARI
jgi:hypothetical protein